MSEPTTEEQLEDLRRAVLSWRFPMLIVSSLGALMMLIAGLGLLALIGTLVMSLGSPFGSSPIAVLFQIAVMVTLYGVVLMPIQLLLRASIAGLQGRTNPRKALQMARLHERYWVWILGITTVYIGVVLIFVFLVGF